jgi:hypothetical protein
MSVIGPFWMCSIDLIQRPLLLILSATTAIPNGSLICQSSFTFSVEPNSSIPYVSYFGTYFVTFVFREPPNPKPFV